MSSLDDFAASYFHWHCEQGIGYIRLNRPERKNPLTFDSYAELTALFRQVAQQDVIKTIVILPNGGNFCSGGDVHEIIGPLLDMDTKGLLQFTRMTGDLVKSMLACGKPIIAAIDGVAVGAGAILAMASDMRIATPQAKTAFLFTRVGLGGCDMGACAILPRIIGQSRAADLLFTGRSMSAEEGERWGFYSRIVAADELEATASKMAQKIAQGPSFAHMMTKTQLNHEWNMAPEQAIEAEAQAQVLCMQTKDFSRAYKAFVNKQQPCFEGD
jgi:enoyl-CoA hydratase/carnithine racemase